MLLKTYRRGSTRCLAIGAVVLSAIVCLYYVSLANQTGPQSGASGGDRTGPEGMRAQRSRDEGSFLLPSSPNISSSQQCPSAVLVRRQADVDTSEIYQKFDFQPAWMKTKEYWDDTFERRYEKQKQDNKGPGLKVILVPHSHNDPGWLKTFEHYFESETRNILNQLVNKMRQYKDWTFIWSEISFLQAWWDQVHPTKQKAFKKFVQSGRIEITTGGWVMTDEANVHLYAMWDQLVEGHQWLKLNLNITPTTGWSIDPFGHGSTFPYILSNSGFRGTIIQRIHYAWKQWFAWKRFGDFMWMPGWEVVGKEADRGKRSPQMDEEAKKIPVQEDSGKRRSKRDTASQKMGRGSSGRDLVQNNNLHYLDGVFNGKLDGVISSKVRSIRSNKPLNEEIKIDNPEILAEYEYLRNLEDTYKPQVDYENYDQQKEKRDVKEEDLRQKRSHNKKAKSKRSKNDEEPFKDFHNADDDEQLMQESVQYAYVSENGKLRSDTEVTYEVRLKREASEEAEENVASDESFSEEKIRRRRFKRSADGDTSVASINDEEPKPIRVKRSAVVEDGSEISRSGRNGEDISVASNNDDASSRRTKRLVEAGAGVSLFEPDVQSLRVVEEDYDTSKKNTGSSDMDYVDEDNEAMMRSKRYAQEESGKDVKTVRKIKKPKNAMLTHNMPFDIYSIKHSCGPHPYTCLNFDFRKIKGEYTEYSIKAQFIDKNNIRDKADLLLEQYARAASLFPHNVALVPIGDDFRYNHEIEFDQQYTNYKMLVDYINSNKDRYGTEISFGTPRDYFEIIENRVATSNVGFPSVTGDFFVYSDIFTEGRPAYWSGYFTTRPFLKILDRTVEHNLRNAEILYTIATNRARQLSQHGKNDAKPNAQKYSTHLRLLEKHYDGLTRARRHLALFQHHDAITGTSKQAVMRDYGLKLFEALQIANKIQEDSIESLLVEHQEQDRDDLRGFILRDVETESYDKLDRKVPISMSRDKRQIVMFNSLPQRRSEVVIIRVNDTRITVLDDQNKEVRIQISPVWNTSSTFSQWVISDKEYEVSFLVRLPPLSLSTYSIIRTKHDDPKKFATIYCDKCSHQGNSDEALNYNVHNVRVQSLKDGTNLFEKSFVAKPDSTSKSKFQLKPMQPGDVQLENKDLKLLFDGRSGFLKSITHKSFLNRNEADGASKKYTTKNVMCNVKFGAYQSAQFHSGAYLFKPDPNTLEPEKDVLNGLSPGVMIISGPVSNELTALYDGFISHTTRIYNFKSDDNTKDCDLMRAVYLETLVDFGEPPKNRETEMFLRLQTDIENGDLPVFYTDSNSFQYLKRTKVPDIGVEGNYYPITSMAFIQDSRTRLTLITDHAQGAASLEPGQLEVMLDRRTLYDDSRGMGEGLVDNKPTIFKNWLLVESVHSKDNRDSKRHQTIKESSNAFADLEVARNLYEKEAQNDDSNGDSARAEEYQLPSLSATRLADALNYPVNVYTVEEPNASSIYNTNDQNQETKTKKEFMTISNKKSRLSFISHPLPCDMRLVNLRTLTDELYHQFPWSSALMMLHRQGYSCQIGGTHPSDTCHMSTVHPDTRLMDIGVKKVTETSLTGVKDFETLPGLGQISVERMDLATYRIDFDE